MPTELEELVSFLSSPHPAIQQIALKTLVSYSTPPQNSIFKPASLQPIKDLKSLAATSTHALKILVNVSDDRSVLACLASDDKFLDSLLDQVVTGADATANLASMLLANMAKSDATVERLAAIANSDSSSGGNAVDRLVDRFVEGGEGGVRDYLAYLFADMSRVPLGRRYFVTRRGYDGVIPMSKLVVFTEAGSAVRRKGVASTIKNCCFDVSSHEVVLGRGGVDLLPYVLLPIMGSEEYSEEEMGDMLEDVQMLPPDKRREPDTDVLVTHLESLLLLTTTLAGREYLRRVNVYAVVREVHKAVEDDGVEEACDRIVQVLMRDEAGEGEGEDEDEDDQIVEVL